MATEKVLFQGFDCKTFENTCWFPSEVPDHHDSKSNDSEGLFLIKVGYVFPMVVVSILSHVEFGPNDHREDAPLFTIFNGVGNV